jgi:hypothetical protein
VYGLFLQGNSLYSRGTVARSSVQP